MINYIQELIFEKKLKNIINNLLINYGKGRNDSFLICYKLKIKDNKLIDYKLRKFKKIYNKLNNDQLINELLEYYNNYLTYIVYQQNNKFYDHEDPLKIL